MKIIDIDKTNTDKPILCNSCYEPATKLVKYQVGNREQKATRIERYCQKHFELIINT